VNHAIRPALEVLVCTYGPRAEALASRLPAPDPRVRYVISHQWPDSDAPAPPGLLERGDLRYLRHRDRGLSVNRNHALRVASGAVCLVADDDLEYLPGWIDSVLAPFDASTGVGFATFMLLDGAGRPRIGDYPTEPTDHDRRTIFKVCSCEVAFRLDAVRAAGVAFNPHLGVGTAIGLGEELVFLRDLLARGVRGRWVPSPIARHDAETTGPRMARRIDASFAQVAGAMAWCRRGAFAYPFVLKESVRLALGSGALGKAPALGAAWWRGLLEARRLGLGPGRGVGPRNAGGPTRDPAD
jgi:glycosyltransferase involved in cell wall biosynthesis